MTSPNPFDLENFDYEYWATTPNGKHILKVVNGLQRNFTKYGASYCPCKIEHHDDNICPCKTYRETSVCKCGLLPLHPQENS